MGKKAAIGIDLGTTYACAAVYYEGKVKIVDNKEGNKTTPAFVAFTDVERLSGKPAKDQFSVNPTNTVYDAKRMIGRNFSDPIVQKDREVWPFHIVEVHGKVKIEVMYKGQKKTFLPEEISSMILTTMKKSCEAFLGYKVTDAVITVPAYFNDSQRQATKDAATIAGLTVLRIINEPTAAAIAFGFEQKLNFEKKVLIYHLGGGTFDITILSIEKGVFTVKAVAGDSHLGGQNIDQRMARYLADQFQKKYGKKCSHIKLLTHSEKAKHMLSSCREGTILIESLSEGGDFQLKMTQARFNELNGDLFEATIEQVKNALRDANFDKSDIDEVVLVGGSTRIPRVRELLSEFFNGKRFNGNINADEAVAIGAAIEASILNGEQDRYKHNIHLHDLLPHSVGILASNSILKNYMSFLIKKNSPIPRKETRTYRTQYDNQTTLKIRLFEVEEKMTADNHWLGEVIVQDIPPQKANKEEIKVTINIDAFGILNVTALTLSTGKKNNIIIIKKRLDEEEMRSDEEYDKVIQAKNSLESLCNTTDASASFVDEYIPD